MKEKFTEAQQQLFISSFYCYLNYDQKNAFVVDLETVWIWMGFSQKNKAKELLIKEFKPEIDYKILLYLKVKQKHDDNSSESSECEKKETRGGHNKQTIMMTIRTFKLFCLKAGTKKAAEVQEYYMKMEETFHEVLDEEAIELKNKLQITEKNAAKKIHNKILECYLNKNIVYLCQLKEHSGKIIVKIGSSQNLKERLVNIKNKYNVEPLLLYVLECRDHVKFERMLHNNEIIRSLYINMDTLADCNIKSRETYLVSQEECDNLINHIKHLYQEHSKNIKEEDEKTQLEILKTKLEIEKISFQREELSIRRLELEEAREKRQNLEYEQYQNTIEETPVVITEPHITAILTPQQIRARENTRSPIVYKFDPKTAQLIARYDSIIDALRANNGTSATALKTAAKENTIYHDYRWVLSERDCTIEPIMPPTKENKTYKIDYVAMIDIKREKIMEVFPSQREAAISRNLKGFTTISRAIKNQSISSGHYWDLFANCSDKMKDEYLKTHTLPTEYTRPNSTIVEQINPISGEVIETYNSVTDVTLKFQMSRATLKKVAEKKEVYNGFNWNIKTPQK